MVPVRRGFAAGEVADDLKGEVGDLRTEMRTDFATVRGDGFALVRADMAQDGIVQLKWSFAFWLGQLFAIVGFLSLLLRTAGR